MTFVPKILVLSLAILSVNCGEECDLNATESCDGNVVFGCRDTSGGSASTFRYDCDELSSVSYCLVADDGLAVCSPEPEADPTCRAMADGFGTYCESGILRSCLAGVVTQKIDCGGEDLCNARESFCTLTPGLDPLCDPAVSFANLCDGNKNVLCENGYRIMETSCEDKTCYPFSYEESGFGTKYESICVTTTAPDTRCDNPSEEVDERWNSTCDGNSQVTCVGNIFYESEDCGARSCAPIEGYPLTSTCE